MDHLFFLTQEGFETFQVNLRTTSSNISDKVKYCGNAIIVVIDQCIQTLRNQEVTRQLQVWTDEVSKFRPYFNSKLLYNNIVIFIHAEVTRTHVYVGGTLFVIGGLVGLIVGLRLQRSVLAPQKMRAVVANGYKGLESITVVEDMLVPSIRSPNQVLVQVKAATIDYLDIKVASGYGRVLRHQLNKYNPNTIGEFPVVLGRDCSGVIVAIGKDVTRVEPGDEVWLAVPMYHPGTISEYLVVSESLVAIKPSRLSFEGSAALPYSLMTAWDALVTQAGLGQNTTKDKRVLVHAGVSGVGIVAVQLVHCWGGHVTTTVSSHAEPLAKMLGAQDVITYDNSNFDKELMLREKFDVIVNTVGPVLIESCMKHCAPGGIVVTTALPVLSSDSYGYVMGAVYSLYLKLKYLFIRAPWLTGCAQGSVEVTGSVLDKVTSLITSGELQPVVDKAYSAQDAEVAFSHIAKGNQIGKTVIRFRSRPLASRAEGSW